jgi:hypothetical protein
MSRFKQSATAYLAATFLVVAGYRLSAFEQGTYFIYQLVEQADAQVVDKRLALDSELFAEAVKTQAESTPQTEERSEFEIDYTSLSTTSTSGFEITPPTDTEVQTTSDTSAFNIGTEDTTISIFGN